MHYNTLFQLLCYLSCARTVLSYSTLSSIMPSSYWPITQTCGGKTTRVSTAGWITKLKIECMIIIMMVLCHRYTDSVHIKVKKVEMLSEICMFESAKDIVCELR